MGATIYTAFQPIPDEPITSPQDRKGEKEKTTEDTKSTEVLRGKKGRTLAKLAKDAKVSGFAGTGVNGGAEGASPPLRPCERQFFIPFLSITINLSTFSLLPFPHSPIPNPCHLSCRNHWAQQNPWQKIARPHLGIKI